eukprot:c17803_g1_i1.p1 GENE.c17803_g1_i1~~c17803_g1_i1.p1  ORF type:complete len:1770 (+),score=486.89 c17803_g1_i1:352-5310(+)
MDLLLEWVPSLKDLEEETGRMVMTPEVEAQSRATVAFLWNEFAYNDVLKADRLIRLVHAAFGKVVTEEELAGVLRKRKGLESSDELWEVLVGSLFRPRMKGRYFVAVTLKEAETIRCLIHNTRGEALLSPRFPGVDTTIALRLIKTADSVDMALMDRSQFFPDHTDTQLKRAMSTLRFLDAQTYYGDEDLSLLIKSFQNNTSFKRLLYYEQNLKARRRKRENWRETPLGQAINTDSEFKFIDTTALSILIDIAMTKDSMAINEAFSMFDSDGDHSLNPAEMFCALEYLGLHPSYEQIYNWMKVADDDDNMELSLKEFTDFIRSSRLASTGSLPVIVHTPQEAQRRATIHQSEYGFRVVRTPEEAAQRIEEVQKDLMIYLGSKNKEVEQEHRLREQNVREKYNELIKLYQEEEEALYGPNPNIQEGVIRYNFQRQNLPRDVEFHGQPDFAPETDKRYKDQQYFVLDPRAFFLFKPIRGPDQTRINEYSITMYIQANSFTSGTLFAVVQEEEDLEGEDPPSILWQDNSVRTNVPVSSNEGKKQFMSRDIQNWQLLTIVMDLRQGKMSSYISGERSTEHEDTKVYAYDGGYAIRPDLGIVMFKQPGNRDSDIGIRFVSIVRSALNEDQVKAIHSEYGIWQCPAKCRPIDDGPDPWNSVDSKKCWYCGKQRKRRGDIPEINPDINPTSPTYGITTIVSDNFEKLIVETKHSVFLLAYSPSNFSKDDKRLNEFRKLGRLMAKATPVTIATLNLDENELFPEHEVLMPDLGFPPILILFHPDYESVVYDTNKHEVSLAGFLDFFHDNISGFDFGRYMHLYFKRYWANNQISERLQAMRAHLLKWLTTAERKGSPLRYLSMYLSNGANFQPSEEVVNDNSAIDIRPTEFELRAGLVGPRFDSKELLVDLVSEVSFTPAQVAKEGWTLVQQFKINDMLEDMVSALARHHPQNPGQFLGDFLLSRPVHFDKTKVELKNIEVVKVKNQNQMLQSEVIGSWPNIRKAVISAPTPSATIDKYKSTITPLLERGMPIDVSPYGHSILYMAAAQGNVELVKYAFAHMANLHKRSKSGNLPVEVAAAMGHLPIVQFLIENGSFFGASLHYAAASGQVPVMNYLLEQGVEPDLFLKCTPLEVSIVHGHMPATALLLEYGADKERLLSPRLQREYQLVAPKKKKADAKPFPRPIDLARRLGQTTILRALSSEDEKRGMETNVVNYVRACLEAGQTEIKLLPAMDVNARDAHGWTPLMQAALTDDGKLTRALFDLGASYTVRNVHGFSAVMWAHWCESKNFLEALQERHGENSTDMDNVDQEGYDILEYEREDAKSSNPAVHSLLDTSSFRINFKSHASTISSAGDSFSKKQEADLVRGLPVYSTYVMDENDVPTVSLEDFILSLGSGKDNEYPGGNWEGNVAGFISSCKLFVQNLLASGSCPSTIGALDMFALHIYTRSDCNYFHNLNKALRANDAEEIKKWQPFSWSLSSAINRLRPESGVYFRGIKQLFNHVQSESYLPGQLVPWGAFTSSSKDHRVAANFMYGKHVSDEVRGVVFKIWGTTPVSLKRFAFFPEEEEYLFAPNTVFKVIAWYEATDANVRRGTSNEGRSQEYVVNADDIVQAVPLQHVTKQEDLEKQLHHNKVVLVELKEVETQTQDETYQESDLQL